MPSITQIQLAPGDVLYRQGDPNDWVYIVETGEIVLYSTQGAVRTNWEKRGAGAIVGELSIITNQPRKVTVEALTDCKIYMVAADHILARLEQLDPILRACIDTSLQFSTRLNEPGTTGIDDLPLAPGQLRNATELIEHFKFERDILQGLTNGEFSMVYQPIVRLTDGRMVGFESLMRWTHPVHGNIRPDQFIDVAEKMGSIGVLTEFALTESCAALHRMQRLSAEYSDLFVSVNISGQDIGRRGFVDFLDFVLDKNDLDSKKVKLEVTERALVPDSKVATENLDRLRTLGCGISIDDFGTGYSNLGRLKTLPLTALKIDRAFAGEAHSNTVSRSIVRLLVRLGREMGVDIVAEGLETIEDVQTLRRMGCRFAQGFYFHRPSTEGELAKVIADGGAPQPMMA